MGSAGAVVPDQTPGSGVVDGPITGTVVNESALADSMRVAVA